MIKISEMLLLGNWRLHRRSIEMGFGRASWLTDMMTAKQLLTMSLLLSRITVMMHKTKILLVSV